MALAKQPTLEGFEPPRQRVTLTLDYDDFPESPEEWAGQWKLYSFNRRHSNFYGPDDVLTIGMRRKLAVGTAFFLDYYEHGRALWMLREGHHPAGVEFQWDGTRYAGILVWEHKPSDMGAKTYAERAKDAQGFLDTYNSWMNGDVYGYTIDIVDEDGEPTGTHDSCWGFYGEDDSAAYMFDEIRANLESEHAYIVSVEGPAAWLADYHKLPMWPED